MQYERVVSLTFRVRACVFACLRVCANMVLCSFALLAIRCLQKPCTSPSAEEHKLHNQTVKHRLISNS